MKLKELEKKVTLIKDPKDKEIANDILDLLRTKSRIPFKSPDYKMSPGNSDLNLKRVAPQQATAVAIASKFELLPKNVQKMFNDHFIAEAEYAQSEIANEAVEHGQKACEKEDVCEIQKQHARLGDFKVGYKSETETTRDTKNIEPFYKNPANDPTIGAEVERD
ncbi:MAG: hypothetical protein FWE16_04395 [Firmicutes bacterium]|nr:hypothetical protein [Bacillota bacterium]